MLNTLKVRRFVAAGAVTVCNMLAAFNASAQALPGVGSGVGPGIDSSVAQNAVKDSFNGAIDNTLDNRFESVVKWALNIPLNIGMELGRTVYGDHGDNRGDEEKKLTRLTLKFAYVESRFDDKAINTRSSSCGQLQFTYDTFIEMLKKYGAEGGYENLADKIQVKSNALPNGLVKISYAVPDKRNEQKIRESCKNENISYFLGKKRIKEIKDRMESRLGREPDEEEIYAGIVFGPAGGAKIVKTREESPHIKVNKVIKSAQMDSNPELLRDDKGQPKTVGNVLKTFDEKLNDAEGPAQKKAAEMGFAL
jgi:hypothetical protein